MDSPIGAGGAVKPRMSWAQHVRITLMLGLPLAGAQLAQMAINMTDVIMLGWYGTDDLAAGVLGTQAFLLTFMFGSGFAHAIIPIASQAEGRGDIQGVRRSVRMGLWVTALFGLAVMPMLWHIETILLWLGQEPDLAQLAGDYMRIAQWGLFPALGTLALRAFYSAVSRTQIILWATLVGTLSNALFNYMFIFGRLGAPELGVEGAAIASLISATLILLVLIGWIIRHELFASYDLFARLWRPDWAAFFEVLWLGLPIALTIVAETSLFFATAVMMGWLGTVPLAAHGIAMQLISMSFMVPLGLSGAATVRIGQAIGRRDGDLLSRAAIASIGVAGVIAILAALMFFLVPEPLIGLFLDSGNPEAALVLATAVPLLTVAAGFQFFDSMQVTGAGLLRGLKDTKTPLAMAVLSYWGIGMPTAYLLGIVAGYGGVGIWSGLAIGLAIAAVLLNGRFFARVRQLSFT
ncbi:MATE family efflux transporter [Pseudohoeflea coraliihabitans]|uniref:Multidrug-efflux transporter n=1 Tax=Pseudohoeflea coraliihabitans TaxID=2860393 RepID=A0ABS6WJE8_9HYPH|nr:MATE family efflux transporter [Pseudohoeflea sp. DP4N28-3]MBW3096064.1 MATE family efflux transporter [Pseudohoeflea sp. DP4N28-3]